MDNLKRKIETDPDYTDISDISFKKPRTDESEKEGKFKSLNKVIFQVPFLFDKFAQHYLLDFE